MKKSEENPRDEGDRVVDDRSVEDSRSRSRSTDRGEGLPAAQRLAALLADAYRAHHAGARLFISAPDLLKLRKLLTQGFSEDDVLKMAEVMWTITRTEDRWLFAETQERGVKLLVHAATRLHRIATERAGTGRLDLQPSPSDSADVVSARVHELLLKATTDEELYERWLAPLTFVDAGAKVIVCTPTLEHRQHVMTLELEDKLLRAITEVLGPRNLEFYVDRDATKATVEQPVNNREARG